APEGVLPGAREVLGSLGTPRPLAFELRRPHTLWRSVSHGGPSSNFSNKAAPKGAANTLILPPCCAYPSNKPGTCCAASGPAKAPSPARSAQTLFFAVP